MTVRILPRIKTDFQKTIFLNQALWLVDFQKIDFSLRTVRINNNTNFSEVRDSRVNARAKDIFQLAIVGDVSLVRRNRNLRWENNLLLRNAQTKIGDDALEETKDDLELESTFDVYGISRTLKLPPNANFFCSFRYDTELSATENESSRKNPLQQDLYAKVGIGSFGQAFQEFRFGYFGRFDFAKNDLDSGFELNMKYRNKFDTFTANTRLRARYLIGRQNPIPGGELGSFELTGNLEFPIAKNLKLKPQVALFLFRDKLFKETASSVQLFLNLSYTRDWKLQYF